MKMIKKVIIKICKCLKRVKIKKITADTFIRKKIGISSISNRKLLRIFLKMLQKKGKI